MATDPPSPSPSLRDPPGLDDRLDSWKDIATHLRRDVSTVQRWEKREQMPVHRHVHDKQGSVYAFRSELDTWSRGRALRHPEQAADGADEDARPAPWSNRALFIGGLGLALAASIAIGAAYLGSRSETAPDATAAARPAVTTRPVSPEAEDLSQRARYLSVRTTDADNQAAIALLEKAIALEPEFARAHAEPASAFVTRLAYVSPEQTAELEQRAFAAAERALSLDPNVPEAYLARGDLLWTQSHRFAHDRAVQEFRRALALNPNSDEAHRRLARVLVHIGRFDEALRHADQALAVNPSNAQALNSRAQALLWMGRDEEALAILLSIPGPVLPELVEANTVVALHQLGRREDAWSHLRLATRRYGNDPSASLRGVEALLVADSDPRRAQALIDAVKTRNAANPSHHAAYFVACALARMGRGREAVDWLRDAAATGFPNYALFARDPNLDRVRADPSMKAFMAEMESKAAAFRQ
jgi:tetratricopeptide (TPR) repeat protein